MPNRADAAHLLRRTEYWASDARIAELEPLSIGDAVDNVMAISTTPVPIPAGLDYHSDDNGYNQFVTALQWWMDRMAGHHGVTRPFQEKMTFFWHSILCTSWQKVFRTDAMMEQNKLFRDSALGNYRNMVQTMSIQPAMLIYLDNVENFATSPNQNFARELMELFTMGVGNYSEDDVTAAARAWTGHGIDWDTYEYVFRTEEWAHDNGNKAFLGDPPANLNGPDIVTRIFDRSKPQALITCKYLTRKLWEHFAYQNPEQWIVDEIAQVLYDNDFNTRNWVRAMLVHPQFYSQKAKQGLVMQPVDWYVTLMRITGLRAAALNPQWSLDGMGQTPFQPPNVSGWRPNMYWINTSALGARADAAEGVTWTVRDRMGESAWDAQFRAGGIDDIDAMIDRHLAYFKLDLTPASRAAAVKYLTDQRAAEGNNSWWAPVRLFTLMMLMPEGHLA